MKRVPRIESDTPIPRAVAEAVLEEAILEEGWASADHFHLS